MREPVLLWDVMDTLVRDPFREVMPAFFGMSLDELIRVKHPTAWVEFETGQLDETTFLQRFFADGRDYDAQGFKTRIQISYDWIEGMQPLLAELHERGYEMHVLSNYPVWYRWIEERIRLSRYVAWSFVSCHTGVRKPSVRAYLGAAEHLGVEPGQCLFIDDRTRNVDAAREVGMQAAHFDGSVRRLRAELAARGVT